MRGPQNAARKYCGQRRRPAGALLGRDLEMVCMKFRQETGTNSVFGRKQEPAPAPLQETWEHAGLHHAEAGAQMQRVGLALAPDTAVFHLHSCSHGQGPPLFHLSAASGKHFLTFLHLLHPLACPCLPWIAYWQVDALACCRPPPTPYPCPGFPLWLSLLRLPGAIPCWCLLQQLQASPGDFEALAALVPRIIDLNVVAGVRWGGPCGHGITGV